MATGPDELRAAAARAAVSFSQRAVTDTVANCPLNKSWIAIELLGEDGVGVADAAYRITLPDGDVRSGLTDADGKARVDGIAPGTCQVCFPELHHDVWTQDTTSA